MVSRVIKELSYEEKIKFIDKTIDKLKNPKTKTYLCWELEKYFFKYEGAEYMLCLTGYEYAIIFPEMMQNLYNYKMEKTGIGWDYSSAIWDRVNRKDRINFLKQLKKELINNQTGTTNN